MKFLLMLPLLVLLAACEPTEEEKFRLKNALPDGCEVISVGEYGSIRELIIVTCPNRNVTTTSIILPNNKTTKQISAVVID